MDNDEEEFDQLVCVTAVLMHHYYLTFIHKEPCMNSTQTRHKWLIEILGGNVSRCFNILCTDLEDNYGLKSSRRTCGAEMLGMFLYILGQSVGNQSTMERFQHSSETVSRYFDKILDSVCRMSVDLIKPLDPDFITTPKEISEDSINMSYFKDCIGAIDGVHIPTSISSEDQIPFIGRKGTSTQNVMVVCSFDKQFIFAVAGWEGSAHDARVFQTTITNHAFNFPNPPPEKYYLVDAGYSELCGYLGPYKGERYHLPEFSLFNYKHSSLRSVIERTFGVWKNTWKILRSMPSYPFKKQVKIVIATMALHNYIRRYSQNNDHFDEMMDEPSHSISEHIVSHEESYETIDSTTQDIIILKDGIAASLMEVQQQKYLYKFCN
ncbi:DDE Tnp4 domain-containing protein [Citrus sinensis]|uniref:DDE Tnp4 domain-containing protein n=1 Tax=Citrus sinensis TaxID=2711 RepID=A0ACB8N4Y2_CITSI|nr:DDE Tnp4 domain-containing protein [Citrus sinensis]